MIKEQLCRWAMWSVGFLIIFIVIFMQYVSAMINMLTYQPTKTQHKRIKSGYTLITCTVVTINNVLYIVKHESCGRISKEIQALVLELHGRLSVRAKCLKLFRESQFGQLRINNMSWCLYISSFIDYSIQILIRSLSVIPKGLWFDLIWIVTISD